MFQTLLKFWFLEPHQLYFLNFRPTLRALSIHFKTGYTHKQGTDTWPDLLNPPSPLWYVTFLQNFECILKLKESKSSLKTENPAYLGLSIKKLEVNCFFSQKVEMENVLMIVLWYYMLEQYLFHNDFSFAMNSNKTLSGIV